MDTAFSNQLYICVTENNNTATLLLNGHFVFDSHHNFTDTYNRLLKKSTINTINIDLAEVVHIDSSALGMLLLLLDRVQALNKSLTLSRPSFMVAGIFEIANFHNKFSIQ